MDARKNHNFCGTVLSLRKNYGFSELFSWTGQVYMMLFEEWN